MNARSECERTPQRRITARVHVIKYPPLRAFFVCNNLYVDQHLLRFSPSPEEPCNATLALWCMQNIQAPAFQSPAVQRSAALQRPTSTYLAHHDVLHVFIQLSTLRQQFVHRHVLVIGQHPRCIIHTQESTIDSQPLRP